MKNKKLQFVIMVLIDIVLIATYVFGFYFVKYRMPRKLVSANIKVEKNRPSKLGTIIDMSNVKATDKELTYESSNIGIKIYKKSEIINKRNVAYQVADIYITNIESLKRVFAKDTYGIGYVDDVYKIAKGADAILAINGDYYSYNDDGLVIANGTIYRDSFSDEEICVIYYDGTMEIYKPGEITIQDLKEDGAYQAWSFGPSLMENNKARTEFKDHAYMNGYNPRAAIGYYSPGHYAFITVDGRNPKISEGITLNELAKICEDLGLKKAYNLDGGDSAYMYFKGKAVNNPAHGGRDLSDIVCIQEVK